MRWGKKEGEEGDGGGRVKAAYVSKERGGGEQRRTEKGE